MSNASKSNKTYIKANASVTKRTTPKAAKPSDASVITDEEKAKQDKLHTPRVIRIMAQTDVTARSIGGKIKGMFKSVVKAVKSVTHDAASRITRMGLFGQTVVLSAILCGIAALIYTAIYGAMVGAIIFVYLMVWCVLGALIGLAFQKIVWAL